MEYIRGINFSISIHGEYVNFFGANGTQLYVTNAKAQRTAGCVFTKARDASSFCGATGFRVRVQAFF